MDKVRSSTLPIHRFLSFHLMIQNAPLMGTAYRLIPARKTNRQLIRRKRNTEQKRQSKSIAFECRKRGRGSSSHADICYREPRESTEQSTQGSEASKKPASSEKEKKRTTPRYMDIKF